MKASQLRDLSRKYASGGITRDDYLAKRRELIDAITRGDTELKYRELDPPGSSRQPGSSKPSRTFLAAGGLLLVLLIAFAAHFLSGNGEPQVTAADTEPEKANPAIELLAAFESEDDWSDESLARVEAQWQALSQADRDMAKESLPYRRIAREVQTRIREHEALVSAGGSPDALMRAARLRTFAERLGIAV